MDPPDILFWCCSRQWWWCCLNWKRPGAVSVEFSMARQWGNTAILPIFSDIDVNFCFHEEYFPPTTFFISYQYRGTNIWVFKMRQNWNFCFDGKSVTTTMNNWTCARWDSFCVAKKTRGAPSFNSWLWPKTHWFHTQFISQPSLLTQTTLHNSLQPNQSRPSPTTRTTLWMWKLQKTRRIVKQSLFSFGHQKKTTFHSIFKWTVGSKIFWQIENSSFSSLLR